jgi:hypothetical protein
MTEAEWLSGNDPRPMLKFLRGRASDRKVRLFACACCRHVWDRTSAPGKRAVEASEDFADGTAAPEKMEQALWKAVQKAGYGCAVMAACWTANARRSVNERAPFEVAKEFAYSLAKSPSAKRWKAARDAELRAQAELLRCVVANPFRPAKFSAQWRTDTVLSLARQMYESRDFSAMPILADALQDAGCDNDDVLSHCRDADQVHVRGCWVVDLVLGKE